MELKTRRPLPFFCFVSQSWWLFVVLFVTLGLYCEGMRRKGALEKKMVQERAALAERIDRVQREKGQLELEIASLNDPEWVEQILKRKLGVVSENQTKVYFK